MVEDNTNFTAHPFHDNVIFQQSKMKLVADKLYHKVFVTKLIFQIDSDSLMTSAAEAQPIKRVTSMLVTDVGDDICLS